MVSIAFHLSCILCKVKYGHRVLSTAGSQHIGIILDYAVLVHMRQHWCNIDRNFFFLQICLWLLAISHLDSTLLITYLLSYMSILEFRCRSGIPGRSRKTQTDSRLTCRMIPWRMGRVPLTDTGQRYGRNVPIAFTQVPVQLRECLRHICPNMIRETRTCVHDLHFLVNMHK